MAKFVIKQSKSGKFNFALKAGNGETILVSESYSTEKACENGVESVRKNAAIESRFDKLVAKNGQYYFNLKATNGEIVGTSEMYVSTSGRDNGIVSVMKNAPIAEVVIQSEK